MIKEKIKLLYYAKITALIFTVLLFILSLVNVGLIIFALLQLLILYQCYKIEELIEKKEFDKAKNKALIWGILSFLFINLIVGIMLLFVRDKIESIKKKILLIPPPPPP